MNTTGYMYQIAQSTIVIPEAGWEKEDELWVCTVIDANVRDDTSVDIFVDKESMGVSLCTAAKPEDGQVRLYAYTKPSEDVRATIKITEVRA